MVGRASDAAVVVRGGRGVAWSPSTGLLLLDELETEVVRSFDVPRPASVVVAEVEADGGLVAAAAVGRSIDALTAAGVLVVGSGDSDLSTVEQRGF